MINLLERSRFPIIVVEGPDGAGKTALSETLKEYLGARYIHLTYRFKDRMHLYHGAAIRLCARMAEFDPVVLDRWWPSEIVYADVYRGGSKFAKYYLLLEHIASSLGVVYVVCLPEDRDRYLTQFNVLKGKRAEMYDEGMDRVYSGYKEMMDSYFAYRDNVVRYDMFENYHENPNARGALLRSVCQNILEFAEDYRSTL